MANGTDVPRRTGADALGVYPALMRYPGRLIAVEGIDGSGKSTHVQLLGAWLRALGQPVHVTSWNSSPLIHDALRDAKRARILSPATFSLMHAADLADRLEQEVLPYLRVGHLVLADRWVCTALARDQARGLDLTWVRRVYAMAPRPDLTVFFRLPVEVALGRILAGRGKPGYHESGRDLQLASDAVRSYRIFQQRVLDNYDALVACEGLAVIDALQPARRQQARLRELVTDLLAGPAPREEAAAGLALPAGQP